MKTTSACHPSNNENIISTAPELPETAQSYDVEAELIRTLYQLAYTALIGVVATATGITAVFFNEVSNQLVAIWLIIIYVLSLYSFLILRCFRLFGLIIGCFTTSSFCALKMLKGLALCNHKNKSRIK